jgi:preprotein translocase subunit SecA
VSTPSAELRRTHYTRRSDLPSGLDARAYGFAGRIERLRPGMRWYRARADRVRDRYRDLSTTALTRRIEAAREAMGRRHMDEGAIEEALAVTVEVGARECGLRAHPEQIIAALAVQRGSLIEMATGEGKTLVIGLAAAVSAWRGRPCHVFTANDYLATRDAAALESFYHRCNLRSGCVIDGMPTQERRKNYGCDITYATPREGAADFLRDRLALGALGTGARRLLHLLGGGRLPGEIVQRGLYTAIVDEADNTLIDEAVTPLIISRKVCNPVLIDAVKTAHALAEGLQRGADYSVDELFREIHIPEAAAERIETEALPEIWSGPHRRMELLRQALTAREFYLRDKHYVVEGGEILIVDEFTGRLMSQRMWMQGLHQAIETKEGLDPGEVSQTLARMSFQRYFRRYGQLAGLSGTIAESASEVWQVYGLPVLRVPTHRPCIRLRWPDRYFAGCDEKWKAVAAEVQRLHAQRRPLLIGTRTIAASEEIARQLTRLGLQYRLLNATRHHEEAEIVAGAGHAGRITIATNMAGRGTDIVLGPGVRELGGLHVLAAEPNDSHRIDRQLFGRAGRQGDPGSAQLFAAMDDALLIRFAPDFLRRRAAEALAWRAPGSRLLAAALVHRAQRIAEQRGFEQRREVMRLDDWLDESLSFAGSND